MIGIDICREMSDLTFLMIINMIESYQITTI